ncbi:hypothetical protein MBLNU13_g08209t2 [Cladosporium sp. NU13]
MRPGLMRTLLPSRIFRANNGNALASAAKAATAECSNPPSCLRNCRCFARIQDLDSLNREVWFSSSAPRSSPELGGGGDHKQPDERTLQLGKTIQTLHEHLPTLLQTPLPSETISPRISLHLFPSTHPHLPTVSGRIAYIAALWTAPVAWGRIPLVGNVKLTILSERMVRYGGSTVSHANREEKLIVKWKTCGKTEHRDGTGGIYRPVGIRAKDPMDKIKNFISGTKDVDTHESEGEDFCGIFIFEFDEQGRIVKHTIEHTEQGGNWDKTRVVSVTDWLLGTFSGKKSPELPALAWCEERPDGSRIRIVDRSRRIC